MTLIHGCDISDDNSKSGMPVDFFRQYQFVIIQAFNEHGHLQSSFATNWSNAASAGIPRGVYGWPIPGQNNFALGASLASAAPGVELGAYADYEHSPAGLASVPELEDYLRGIESKGVLAGFYSNLSELPDTAFLNAHSWWFANPSNNPPPRPYTIEQYAVVNGVDLDVADDSILGDFVATVDDIAAGVQKGMLSVVQTQGLSGGDWQPKLDTIIANQEKIIQLMQAGNTEQVQAHGTIKIDGQGTF